MNLIAAGKSAGVLAAGLSCAFGLALPARARNLPAGAASTATAHAEPLQAITVTGSVLNGRLPVKTAAVVVIDREQIESSTATNVAELLAGVTGTTIRSRGAPGVQADVGIRGGNFEQTLVLVNGIPIRNPQTGHHNLDLPLGLAAVERIVIIKGPGAIQYGGSATSGVINIITRRPHETMAEAEVWVGSNHSRGLRASLGMGGANFSQMLSASAGRSAAENAQQPNDADARHVLYTGRYQSGRNWLGWGAGASSKKFGAWGFYSEHYPNAREWTRSRLAWLGGGTTAGKWSVSSRVYWNGHHDKFLTVIGNAGFLNQHDTDVLGLLARAQRTGEHATTAFGVGWRHAAIQSNALSNHDRDERTLWAYRRQQIAPQWRVDVGLNHVGYGSWGDYWLPSGAVSWQFQPNWNVYASAARSARIPSYTELFLNTSANRGNPNLVPEVARTWELGMQGHVDDHRFAATWFQRRVDHLIDWMASPGSPTRVAANISDYRARGVDVSWNWLPYWRWLDSVKVGYSRLHVDVGENASAVAYALHVPRQTWRLHVRMPLAERWSLSVDGRRPDYARQDAVVLLAAKLAWSGEHFHASLSARNLLDKDVVEAGFAPIPGRWITLSVGSRF